MGGAGEPVARFPLTLLVDECESTNDLARQNGEAGAPSGSWFSARNQTRGRGRAGNSWISQPGNLFLSVILRPEEREPGARPLELTWVPLLAACVCWQAVLEVRPELRARLRIKWPNDLWLGDAKAGGILCESVGGPRGQFLIVGIGLNTSQAPTLAERETASMSIDPEALRSRIATLLQAAWLQLQGEGSGGVRMVYESAAYFRPGDKVVWQERGVSVVGQVRGLGPYGDLRVLPVPEAVGIPTKERSIFAEEVSRVQPTAAP